MKRIAVLIVFSLLLLAVPFSMFAYDTSPAQQCVLPEAIWAAAGGGGTWSTEIQIYARNTADPVNISVWFMYGGGNWWGPFTLTGVTVQHMLRWTNILSYIDYLDTDASHTYYGRVGAVLFSCVDADDRILVQAKTLHSGGYGKTMNALNRVDSSYAIFSPWRGLMIQGITNYSPYRSTVGLYNDSANAITVQVGLINYSNAWLGWQNIALAGWEFLAFDPFTRFSVSGTYGSCRIWVSPQAGTGRCMAFGAMANGDTNDPSALIAVAYD